MHEAGDDVRVLEVVVVERAEDVGRDRGGEVAAELLVVRAELSQGCGSAPHSRGSKRGQDALVRDVYEALAVRVACWRNRLEEGKKKGCKGGKRGAAWTLAVALTHCTLGRARA